MYWFTADEHYGHANSIKYCNRPFKTVEEMDERLIANFNSVVAKDDVTVHAGDFCWLNKKEDVYNKYVKRLNGTHILLIGSHDHWQPTSGRYIWKKRIDGQLITVCHYCLRTWPSSHYNAWHVFGHSHGRLEPIGKSWDIGVDTNNYYPYSWEQIKEIMKNRPDNPGLVKKQYV